MRVILELERKEAEKLLEILTEHCDEGPPGEGWSSAELNSITDIVGTALNKAALGADNDA